MDLIFTFKVVCLKQHPKLAPFFVPTQTTTRGHPFKLAKIRLNKANPVLSLSYRVVNIWNALPENVVLSNSIAGFKEALDNFLWHQNDTWHSDPPPGSAYPRQPFPPHLD